MFCYDTEGTYRDCDRVNAPEVLHFAVISYFLIHIVNQCTGSHFWSLEGYIFVTGVCTEENKIRI